MLNLNDKAPILIRERAFIPQPAYKPHFPTHPFIANQAFSTIQKSKINRKDVISHCRYQSTFSSPKGLKKQENLSSPHNFKTPKISFSYNRKRQHHEETNRKYLPGSCRQIFKDHPGEMFPIQQFSIAAKKPGKQDKRDRLKIHQCISHVISTPQSHITEIDDNVLPFLPSISETGKNSSLSSQCSEQNQGKNTSKVASTLADSSTFGGSRHDLSQQAQHPRLSKGFLFDLSQSKQQKPKLTLLDRVSPSKLLKKTIILSKYDFGGMFKQNYKSQNENPQPTHSPRGGLKFSSTSANKRSSKVQISISSYRQSNKWQNCMKCLFSDNDLKESIHCGPDLPSSQPNHFLMGFGRQVEASCIPEQQ